MCNHDFRDDMCVTCLEEEISRLKDLAADAEAGAKENAALLELSYRKRDSLTRELARLEGLADEIEADAKKLALGETFHGGLLHGASVFNVMMWAVRRIRAKREECRVCVTKAVGLPTPGYTHDESCAQREEKK